MARHIDGLYLITKEYEQNKTIIDWRDCAMQ